MCPKISGGEGGGGEEWEECTKQTNARCYFHLTVRQHTFHHKFLVLTRSRASASSLRSARANGLRAHSLLLLVSFFFLSYLCTCCRLCCCLFHSIASYRRSTVCNDGGLYWKFTFILTSFLSVSLSTLSPSQFSILWVVVIFRLNYCQFIFHKWHFNYSITLSAQYFFQRCLLTAHIFLNVPLFFILFSSTEKRIF